VAEAGTGTGKTFAYLVPALLAGGKVIISTGTKTLQDQLFNRDLPTVRAALKVPVSIALLKGRANYVCHYHLERATHAPGASSRARMPPHLRAIARFAETTQTGDKAECIDVPEDSGPGAGHLDARQLPRPGLPAQGRVLRDAGAAQDAMEADVVVVNHHLFFADVMLRDEGMGELLPACNAVIFDEAHQLPETASLFFGDSVSTAQVLELARDTRSETVAAARDCVAMIDQTPQPGEGRARPAPGVRGRGCALSAAQAAERENFDAMVEGWRRRSPTSTPCSPPRPSAPRAWATACAAPRRWPSAWRAGASPRTRS
jgi:ATP-dependent DNA helicase DinG